MAIVQISKIQQRSGNLVDLPQLDEAEFGFASDEKRLFIGKTTEGIENIEVLTSYSTVDFSQINGSVGNLDMDSLTISDGQVLTYDGNNWVNRGGDAGGLITLGDVSNVKITGGAIDYVLTTDGTGNLNWTPKSTILAEILNVETTVLSRNQTFATATDATDDYITIDDLTGYVLNTAVTFSGTTFGNVTGSTNYYVANIDSPNNAIKIATSNDGNVSNILALTTDTGNMALNIVGTVVTTTEENFFTEGAEATITNAKGMVELNGFSYYLDILPSGNSFALYTDPLFANAIDSTTFTKYAYTDVTATTASTNIITVGDSTSFVQFDPVIFIGSTFGNITANQTYYIANIVSSTEIKIATSDDGNTSNIVTLTTASGTANVYSPGGRVLSTIGGTGSSNAGGTTYSVQYNNSNLLDGDANFTYDFGNRLLTVLNGNANIGNLNTTGIVYSNRLVSYVATGVAPPLQVTSTDRVGNLNVSYSNVTDFSVVTAQTTGTFYPTFVSSSSTGNRALGVNSAFSFNALTGNLSATLLSGTLTTAAQPNITSLGTLTGLTVNGNANSYASFVFASTNIDPSSVSGFAAGQINETSTSFNAPGIVIGSSSGQHGAIVYAANTMYFGTETGSDNTLNTRATLNSNGEFSATSIVATGNITGANILGALANGTSNVNIPAVNGNVNISVGGTANVVRITSTGANFSGTVNATGIISGSILTAMSAITSSGTINSSGNANFANVGTQLVVATGNISATQFISNITTGAAPLIVTSTTKVANLNADTVDGYDTATIATASTIVVRDTNGNITGNNISGTLTTAAQPNITSLGTLTGLGVNGTITAVNITANTGVFTGNGSALSTLNASNITSGTLAQARLANSSLTVNGTAISLGGSGTITASTTNALTINNSGAGAASGSTFNGGSAVTISYNTVGAPSTTGTNASGNWGISITGSAGSATTAGTVTTNAQPNITSVGTLSSLTVTANTTTGGIKTDNYYYANGVSISFAGSYSNSNVASYLPTYTGTIGAGAATHYGTTLTTGANTTAGTITGNWTLSAGSRLQSTYADLAEYYTADANYEPGTVLEFGGVEEVTLATDGTNRVAGVVSTNPAYVMNSSCEGKHIIAIALQGRVPCKVRSVIKKGDMLVSAGEGFARVSYNPQIGTVIGKALQNFDGVEGIIEVAVGRL